MNSWKWDCNPSEEYLTAGLPVGVVAGVERLATEIAALGEESVRIGRPIDREGGLREFDLMGGRGFMRRQLGLSRTALDEDEATFVFTPHGHSEPGGHSSGA